MALILKGFRKLENIALDPTITGALLFGLTKAPASIREPLLHQLSKYLSDENVTRFIKYLTWAWVLGFTGTVNRALNSWALNNWRWKSDKDKWMWSKEIAVVTGGCSGIGLETVRGLMRKSIKVAVLDIQPLPKELENYGNIKYFYCDVTSTDSISEAASAVRSKWGDPTILINNAGIGAPHTLLDTSNEWVAKIFTINIVSHFWMVKEFLPSMIKKNHGHVVGLASMASFVAPPAIVDYACTKAAVLAFHEGLDQEIKHIYKTPGVLNTVVHPSWVRTSLVGGYESHLEKTQGKLMKPEHIAKRIVDQIVSCRGGQIVMPKRLAVAAGIRGLPNWLQELIRDVTVGGAVSDFPNAKKD
ncbi:NAD(P)-binding protein [Tothia fuscella]|uniref:Short-chain dehydrogenase/reductase 3 n=1 Tax=Tothia fuscella TaxID=1048955 RepID=A0A9P4TTJ7_9PEZI|nr:NAD(P)-binding protein [Tothia fuscella]